MGGLYFLLQNIINDCSVCAQVKKKVAAKPKLKKILTHGPHIRYEADLWELDKVIYEKSGFKYILEIIDHFS